MVPTASTCSKGISDTIIFKSNRYVIPSYSKFDTLTDVATHLTKTITSTEQNLQRFYSSQFTALNKLSVIFKTYCSTQTNTTLTKLHEDKISTPIISKVQRVSTPPRMHNVLHITPDISNNDSSTNSAQPI